MLSHKLSISEEILRLLGGKKYPLHNLIPLLLASPKLACRKRQSIANALQKLKKEKLVHIGEDAVTLSHKGRICVEQKMNRLIFFTSPFPKNTTKDLLVLFDIPENRKAEREWFRRQLREFGYEMIQKSVWLGPSPLPKDFVQYVKFIGLKENIKTFKISSKKR